LQGLLQECRVEDGMGGIPEHHIEWQIFFLHRFALHPCSCCDSRRALFYRRTMVVAADYRAKLERLREYDDGHQGENQREEFAQRYIYSSSEGVEGVE